MKIRRSNAVNIAENRVNARDKKNRATLKLPGCIIYNEPALYKVYVRK